MVTDIAFDWLKPKVVMTNTCSVSASVLDERRKKFRSTSEPQQRRLSNLLIALHHGDFSFSRARPPSNPLTMSCIRANSARVSSFAFGKKWVLTLRCSGRRACAAVQAHCHVLLRCWLCVLLLLPSCTCGDLNRLPNPKVHSRFTSCLYFGVVSLVICTQKIQVDWNRMLL